MAAVGPFLRLFLVATLLLGAAGPVVAELREPVGQVVRQSGSVTVLRAAGGTTLQLGAQVYQGDSILTGPDSKIRIAFVDGSELVVGSDSEVRLDHYVLSDGGLRQAGFLTLLRGIVRAAVAGAAGAAPFDISTRLAVASSRSTEWLIEAARDRTSVFVVRGRVAVRGTDGGADVLLEASYGTDVLPGEPPNPAKRWGAARIEQSIARTSVP